MIQRTLITQSQAAKHLGISPQRMGDWVRTGKVNSCVDGTPSAMKDSRYKAKKYPKILIIKELLPEGDELKELKG